MAETHAVCAPNHGVVRLPNGDHWMPQLQVQQVGSIKLIRTYLLNVVDVTAVLDVTLLEFATFLGEELGCDFVVNETRPRQERVYLNGSHNIRDISQAVDRFVRNLFQELAGNV